MNSAKTVIESGVVATLCRQCNMRCGLNVRIDAGKIVDITGNPDHPQYQGGICARGRAAAELAYHPERLVKPLKKMSDGNFVPITLEQALDEIAAGMQALKGRHGAESMAVWTGEAIGFYQQADYARRFIRAFGAANYTSADSLCFSTRYMAYRLVHGYFNPCPDFENTDLIVLWGSNPPVSHPPFNRSISRARKRGARLIVIDPRMTRAARKADLFVQLRPGTDGALAWGIARYMISSNTFDREFVEKYSVGFDDFAEYAQRYTPEYVACQTGVDADMVIETARMVTYHRPRVVHFVAIALEHHENALNNIRAVACLRGLGGSVDIRGGDPWPEGMGGRDLALPDPGDGEGAVPIGSDRYPLLYEYRRECHSMTVIDRMLSTRDDRVRGMIVSGANPALTNPNSNKVTQAFGRLDLLVSRELFLTPTARLAHYVLPAATFLERSELHYHSHLQRVTLSRKVLDIPGVQDEYSFWRELARRLDFGDTYFPWADEGAVNRWILEPTGIGIETLERHPEGYTYKPYVEEKYRERPFATASGKFEFASQHLKTLGHADIPTYIPPRYVSQPSADFPLVLITGARKSLYLHSRYRNIERFRAAIPAAEMEIHPLDATRLGIEDGQRVRVLSAIGSLEIMVKIVAEGDILPAMLQITHGWDDANVNELTDDRRNDPITGFPLLKAIEVRLEKIQ